MTFTNDQWQEAVVYSANNPAGGGTQYTDGAATPANPIGTMPVFDNAGTIAHVSAANPLPVAATVTPAANQRVNAHSGDFVDGAIATLGTEADAAITNPATNGTVIAYLRGILTQLADTLSDGDNLATIATNTSGLATDAHASSIVTNTANIPAKGSAAMAASTPVTIATNDTVLSELLTDTDNLANIPAKGAATTANSTPVNVASDQIVPVKRSSVAVYSLASTQSTGSTQNSGDLTVGPYTEIALDINMTAQSGTNPTVQFFWDRKGADGVYYAIYQSQVYTAATAVLSTSIGAGMAYNQSLGTTGRLRWVIGGSATPTYTFSANVVGK